MSTRAHLSKLQPKAPATEPGTGGMPDITREDVLVALGTVAPRHRLGIELVLARYSDDRISKRWLRDRLPRLVWRLWYDQGFEGTMQPETARKLGHLAVEDFCVPGKLQGRPVSEIAKLAGMDHRTWTRKFSRIYGVVQAQLSRAEEPVLRAVYRWCSRSVESGENDQRQANG